MEAMAGFTSAIRGQIFSTVLFILAVGWTMPSRAINPGDRAPGRSGVALGSPGVARGPGCAGAGLRGAGLRGGV